MKYTFQSISTWSFWRYSLFSAQGAAKVFTAVGVQFLIMEMADFFDLYSKDQYERYAIIVMFGFAVLWVVATRRPISRFTHKVSGKDLSVEVLIGDLFDGENDVVVSSNTSFDTDMASGLIDTASVQGQVSTRFFNANTVEIDSQIEGQLDLLEGVENSELPGKKIEYPIGTVAKVSSHGRTFYFVAMARLNPQGTAQAKPRDVEDALVSAWEYIRHNGNLKGLSIPLIGTGRGRTGVPRKKMVERIAQSFVDASKNEVFVNRLTIVIHPEDAENFAVNMYEIRDYLVHGLHL